MEGTDWGEIIRIVVEAILAILALFYRQKLGATTQTFTDVIEAAHTQAKEFEPAKDHSKSVSVATRRAIEADMIDKLKRTVSHRTTGTGAGSVIDRCKTRSEKAMSKG